MRLRYQPSFLLPLVVLMGCRVTTSDSHGDKDVSIKTPFGGLQVRTDPEKVAEGLGLPRYPGAVLATKEKDGKQEPDTADVHMGFGGFQLRVKAATYTTPDDPDKVEAFYRKALASYGDVIACRNKKAVGTPTHTGQGLGCDDNDGHVNVNGKGASTKPGNLDLRAGSRKHQHIVGIEPQGAGTKVGLVALDLPGDSHESKDKDDKEEESL